MISASCSAFSSPGLPASGEGAHALPSSLWVGRGHMSVVHVACMWGRAEHVACM